MPFINTLGYNVFNPMEVVPQFTCDLGTKKGEKVDYAIMRDGKPIILFECKSATANLDEVHASQLFRYFAVTEARFGVLTNGVVYRFHSDLDEPNKMDIKPFLELNMLELDEALVEELDRFTKASFDLDTTLEAAGELKYTREIKCILSSQLREPSDDFVRFFASQIYSGRMTQSVRVRFAELTKQALNQFVTDRVYDRLKSAMSTERTGADDVVKTPETGASDEAEDLEGTNGVDTTVEELHGYYIVKTILHDVVDVKRIEMRDFKGFCGVLLDHSLLKPICRLRFNSLKNKRLGLINNESRQEERVPIDDLDDIYKYADRLKATVSYYEQPSPRG